MHLGRSFEAFQHVPSAVVAEELAARRETSRTPSKPQTGFELAAKGHILSFLEKVGLLCQT